MESRRYVPPGQVRTARAPVYRMSINHLLVTQLPGFTLTLQICAPCASSFSNVTHNKQFVAGRLGGVLMHRSCYHLSRRSPYFAILPPSSNDACILSHSHLLRPLVANDSRHPRSDRSCLERSYWR